MRLRTVAIGVLGAVLIIPTIACSSDTGVTASGGTASGKPAASASAAPVTVKVGQTITMREAILGDATVTEITLSGLKTGGKGSQFNKPAKGQFITATVTAVVKEGKNSINSSMFKLVAKDGTVYDTTISLDGHDLSANDLAAGQKTTGQIVFDVPKGVEKGGRIALTSIMADGDVGYWTLS